ncbi:NAD(P)/FAD-dependent oxidoreductase [Cellulomonas fimi]|uniref:FAD-dependent pyridine nucleotide-disulfide oxidoreductase n=1 Tax=Cellulomonas fimi (strain ATCC 484 / DSM 20113 / JCM 1341 / CCUG 24087 / LMG 16345 / NBRC 15513 / NCIMB 8980 / NCTC 7547 / NRS-133) TaxID=590998 RepID=F4GYL7_CELFA|nr:FAD-dependent oxidoreductase [Cellulomonas fimi]AEE47134.1 FAD-dependent pyridine nucleotide-disulfide oxidoreductase [Cellulomonas fimi ATCC 484]NNH05628.1 FAD-dependent oxidoreductase [Cellulomonas fimi]VEH35363.1 NADH dehydrogenase-like protein SAV0941 [Cellulomonas fimi]
MPQSVETPVDAAPAAGAVKPSGKPRKVPRVVVLGGGSVGLTTARRLRKRLGKREAAIVVVDPRPYMTYAPFLPEAAAGSIDARNVVAPHRRALKGIDVLQGKVTQIHHAQRTVEITPEEGDAYWITYDHLVVGLGSVARTLPIPGLAEQGIGFKNVEEAIAVRNHVLNRIDVASSTWDPELRKRMLTFVFVGGGFAGIEALAEVEDMARYSVRHYKQIEEDELRFVLVEGSPRILPEVSEELGGYTLEQLRKRNIEIFLSTFLNSCVDGHVVLSNGVEFDAETLVWTAGVKANPVLQNSDLPLDKMGRVLCNPRLQITEADGTVVADAYAAGDCAAVPDLYNPGQFCPPNAQHAVREGKHLGDNLARVLRSAEPTEYKHKNIGAVASLGMYKGVAQMFGKIKVRGVLAWFLHRTYHVYAMPTINRKLRIMAGWTGSILLRREVVALGTLHDPRAEFRAASVPPKPRAVEADAALPPQKAEPGSPAAKAASGSGQATKSAS